MLRRARLVLMKSTIWWRFWNEPGDSSCRIKSLAENYDPEPAKCDLALGGKI